MTINEYLAAFRKEIERLDTYGLAESIDFHEELGAGKQAIVKVKIGLMDFAVSIFLNLCPIFNY